MSAAELRHDLFVYDADETFTSQVESFLGAGLEAHEVVMVIAGGARQTLLRHVLGAAAEFIVFADAGAVYTRPEAALATLDTAVRRAADELEPGIRVYGELPVCRTQAEWDAWITYEAVVNRAFADRPVSLMCGYDARLVPAAVVQQARRAHNVVLTDLWHISREYEEPEALVRSLAPEFEPLPGLRALQLGDPQQVEERLAAELSADAVGVRRARDLVVAAREVLENAQRYGNGLRAVRVGRVGERFVCEITDAGSGLDDPLAGYLPPRPASTSGAGLWIARQLTSHMELHSQPGGLTVRLWI
jgi:anti-sigma regulatory factor (Ser/Thr protein kinase)